MPIGKENAAVTLGIIINLKCEVNNNDPLYRTGTEPRDSVSEIFVAAPYNPKFTSRNAKQYYPRQHRVRHI